MHTRTDTLLLGLAILTTAACADTTPAEPWQIDEPASRVNETYCTDLPNDDLDEPTVTRAGPDRWTIRYPTHRQRCGTYQLDATFDFDPADADRPTYTHQITACNRCESGQTWNFIFQQPSSSGHKTKPDDWAIPQDSATGSTSEIALSEFGAPIARHRPSPQDKPTAESACHRDGNGNTTISPEGKTYVYPSYDSVFRAHMTPDRIVTGTFNPDIQEAATNLLARAPAGPNAETSILWPRLYRSDTSITGMQAASAHEYCLVREHGGDWGNFIRPYAEPYDLSQKYIEQTTPPLELPDELLERLRQIGPDDATDRR